MLWFIVSLAIVPCSCTAPADHVTTSSSDASEPEDAYEPEEFMPPIPPPMTPPIPTTPILGPAPGTPGTPPLAHLMWLERQINVTPCGVVQRRPLPKEEGSRPEEEQSPGGEEQKLGKEEQNPATPIDPIDVNEIDKFANALLYIQSIAYGAREENE